MRWTFLSIFVVADFVAEIVSERGSWLAVKSVRFRNILFCNICIIITLKLWNKTSAYGKNRLDSHYLFFLPIALANFYEKLEIGCLSFDRVFQFVVFKPLRYCLEESKNLTNRPRLQGLQCRLSSNQVTQEKNFNKRLFNSWDFPWIENYKLSYQKLRKKTHKKCA